MVLPGNGERVKSVRHTWQAMADEALYYAKKEGRNLVVAPHFVQDPNTGKVLLKFHVFR